MKKNTKIIVWSIVGLVVATGAFFGIRSLVKKAEARKAITDTPPPALDVTKETIENKPIGEAITNGSPIVADLTETKLRQFRLKKDASFRPDGSSHKGVFLKQGTVIKGEVVRNTKTSEPPNFVIYKAAQGTIRIPFGGRASSILEEEVIKSMFNNNPNSTKLRQFRVKKDTSFRTDRSSSKAVLLKQGTIIKGMVVRNTKTSEPPSFVIHKTSQGIIRIPFGGRASSVLEDIRA